MDSWVTYCKEYWEVIYIMRYIFASCDLEDNRELTETQWKCFNESDVLRWTYIQSRVLLANDVQQLSVL